MLFQVHGGRKREQNRVGHLPAIDHSRNPPLTNHKEAGQYNHFTQIVHPELLSRAWFLT